MVIMALEVLSKCMLSTRGLNMHTDRYRTVSFNGWGNHIWTVDVALLPTTLKVCTPMSLAVTLLTKGVLLRHTDVIYYRPVFDESIHSLILSSNIPTEMVCQFHNRHNVSCYYVGDDLPLPHCLPMHSNRIVLGQVFDSNMRQPSRYYIFWCWICNIRAHYYDIAPYSMYPRLENKQRKENRPFCYVQCGNFVRILFISIKIVIASLSQLKCF
jgi:hypothetical protein